MLLCRYLLHQVVCVKPVLHEQNHPFCAANPSTEVGKLDWTGKVAYFYQEPQAGKSQPSALYMWVVWQMLSMGSLYFVKNNGGSQAAGQMIRDICNFNTRLKLLVEVRFCTKWGSGCQTVNKCNQCQIMT